MRSLAGLTFALLTTLVALAQPEPDPSRRYLIDANLTKYPQNTPKDALQSLVKAADTRKFEYLLAQLADPSYVDAKVKDYALAYKQGPAEARALVAFERLTTEVEQHLRTEPSLLAELRRSLKEGEWDVGADTANVKLPNVVGRKAFFKKIGERWFLENRQE